MSAPFHSYLCGRFAAEWLIIMKTWTKLLAMLCTLTIILALFSGCGNTSTSETLDSADAPAVEEGTEADPAATENADADSKAEPAASADEDPAESAQESAEPAPELTEEQQALLDLIPEGELLTFLQLPLTEETIELSCFVAVHSTLLTTYENLSDMPFYSAMEDATGVHMTFTAISSMGDDGTVLSLMIAADDLTDIGSFGSGMTQGIDNAIEDGTLINLADYFDYMPNYSALIEGNDIFRKAVTTTGGNIPGASQFTLDNTAIYRTGLMARQDWLEALNMDAPETIDEFHEMLLAFQSEFGATAAYDMDQGGGIFTGDSGMGAGGTYLTRAFGTDGGDFYIDDDGNVQSGWLAEGFKDYLTEMNLWYNEGLIAADFATADTAMSDWTDVVNGVNGVIATHASEMEEIKAVSDDPNFELVGIVDPVLNKGDQLRIENCFIEASPTGGYNVSASCKYPEIACEWLDYLYSPNGWLLCNYGIEGESFEYDENGVPHWTELITNNPDGLPSGVVKSMYFVVQGPCLMYSPREFDAYTQNMIDASDIWASNIADETNEYPNVITLVGTEAEEYSAILSDISTYIQEVGVQFIMGTKNLDSDYDAFIEALHAMNVDRLIEIKQAAYDEYISG